MAKRFEWATKNLLPINYDKQLILSAIICAASTQVVANDIAMTQWVDEFALDRYPLTYSAQTRASSDYVIQRNTKEVKSPLGFYVGTQNSPAPLSNGKSDFATERTTLVDSYFGLRQQFSVFAYNVGIKSYNNQSDLVSKNWMQLNLDEYYAGVRFMKFGVGLAQNDSASHSRFSYFQKLQSASLQVDVGTTTILTSGDQYLHWKFNAAKQYKDVLVAFSLNKSFAPKHDLPMEAYLEISQVFKL